MYSLCDSLDDTIIPLLLAFLSTLSASIYFQNPTIPYTVYYSPRLSQPLLLSSVTLTALNQRSSRSLATSDFFPVYINIFRGLSLPTSVALDSPTVRPVNSLSLSLSLSPILKLRYFLFLDLLKSALWTYCSNGGVDVGFLQFSNLKISSFLFLFVVQKTELLYSSEIYFFLEMKSLSVWLMRKRRKGEENFYAFFFFFFVNVFSLLFNILTFCFIW
jgi:hypothetical protein